MKKIRSPFLRALKLTIFTYVPHYREALHWENGGIGLKPLDWFFCYWGKYLTEKHAERDKFLKAKRRRKK